MAEKQEWIGKIQSIVDIGQMFQYKTIDGDKLYVLFAADTFRRRGHRVELYLEPTQEGISSFTLIIHPYKTSIEFTLSRDDNSVAIIDQIISSNFTEITVRGCGTVLTSLMEITDWALHNGWYIQKTDLSTLTQHHENTKQRNTTLQITFLNGNVAR